MSIFQFLANFCVVLALASGKVLQKIFFGQLQPREVEVYLLDISTGITVKTFLTAAVRPNMDVCYRVPVGLYDLS